MKTWMCVVRPRNWDVMKQNNLFGVSPRERKKLAQVQIGDMLAIYVKESVNGVVTICKVVSKMFRGRCDMWSGYYPCQIKFGFIPEFKIREEDPVPLYAFLGRIDQEEGVTVEPLFINTSLIELSHDHFLKLKERFAE